MFVGGPPRLLAVLAACLVALTAALVAEADAEASSSLSQVASARQQLNLDLLAAAAAGYTDQDLGPILDQVRQLSVEPAPSGLSDRASFYRRQAVELESLRISLAALEVSQLDLLRRATTTRLSDLTSELAQDDELGVDPVDLAPIEAQVSLIRVGLATAYSPADFRRAFGAMGRPIDAAQQLRAARAADLAAVQGEAARILAAANGNLDAVRQVGLNALADGRNYATAVAYLRLAPGRQYDLLESDANRLQGTAPQQVAEAAALEERHRDLLHAAMIAGFPAKGIFVSILAEELWAYDHGQLFVDTLVTTGMPQLPTDTGLMRIYRKESPVHFISPFPKGSIYDYGTIDARYALWFQYSGEAIHDSWWRSWYGPSSNLNGHGSHGCIGVPYGPIDALYPWGDVGTPVLVIPGDGSPVATQLAEKTYDDPFWGSGPPT
jgi:L,D-transpeptidase-like protein